MKTLKELIDEQKVIFDKNCEYQATRVKMAQSSIEQTVSTLARLFEGVPYTTGKETAILPHTNVVYADTGPLRVEYQKFIFKRPGIGGSVTLIIGDREIEVLLMPADPKERRSQFTYPIGQLSTLFMHLAEWLAGMGGAIFKDYTA
jgi:hypothetical protein